MGKLKKTSVTKDAATLSGSIIRNWARAIFKRTRQTMPAVNYSIKDSKLETRFWDFAGNSKCTALCVS